MSKIKLICEKCGNEFEVHPYRIKEGARYCSPSCSSSCINTGRKHTLESKKNMSLAHLGKPSPRKGKKLGYPNWNTGMKMSKEHCKKLSEAHKGSVPWNKGKKLHYKVWSYIDGRSKFVSPGRYGDEWHEIRKKVYKRDNYTCQRCKLNKKRLDAHHIIPFLCGGPNTLDNLISLCRKCHMTIERNLQKK